MPLDARLASKRTGRVLEVHRQRATERKLEESARLPATSAARPSRSQRVEALSDREDFAALDLATFLIPVFWPLRPV
jgi:hypothetical protein